MATVERDCGHFLFMAAKDMVVNTYGAKTKDWPEENLYTLISTVKTNIKSDHVPKLMKQYKISKLLRYGEYFNSPPTETTDEKLVTN